MKYCSNCGKELKEGADICLNCGKLVNNQQKKNKNIEKGLSIASLVLGIISILWTFIMILGYEQAIETIKVEYYYNETIIYVMFYYIGYTLFSLTPSIISLVLGLMSIKKEKNAMSTAGIILSGITLVACLFILIAFITKTLW